MSDNHDYLGVDGDPKLRLGGAVLMLQLRGAGYAALICLVVVLGIWLLAVLGRTLPDESRETEDPTPYSYQQFLQDPKLV